MNHINTKAIEQSTKEKVKDIAQKHGRTFNDVWQEVVLERWLARLAISPDGNHNETFRNRKSSAI